MTDTRAIACPCGAARYTATGAPLLRAFCHCTICQRFNHADRGDITLFRARDVRTEADDTVEYRAWKQPPLVRRGTCRECNRPAVEKLHILPLPRIVIVPTVNLRGDAPLPEPRLHIFYDRRVADAQDDLPKHAGYLPSQIAFGTTLLRALATRQSP